MSRNIVKPLVSVAALVSLGYCDDAKAVNWPTYGGSVQRLGVNASETALTPATVSGLTVQWHIVLNSVSQLQPLYVESVPTGAGTHNEVFQTTLSGQVAAINAGSGAIDWTVQLPTTQAQQGSCITAGLGAYGTPTIDTQAMLLYVVDGNGALHALSIANGTEASGYPVQIVDSTDQAAGSFNHSSPTLVGNMLYVTTSGIGACENVGSPYHGEVIAFDTKTLAVSSTFYPISQATGGGGIWGPGGAMIDPVTQDLFVATGNALAPPDYTPLGESVVSLDQNLNILQTHSPGKGILTKKGDYDFGSTPVPIDVAGCPALLAVLNKTGNLYVYQRQNLSAGPVQILDMSNGGAGSNAFFGMAAYDAATQLLLVNNPLASKSGTFTNGAIALSAPSSPTCNTAPQQLTVAWQTTYGSNEFSSLSRSTQPMVAGGLVWLATGAGRSVMALNEATGAPVWSTGAAVKAPTISSVTVADGQLFVQTGLTLVGYALP
jgi:outer membrane protein assembly factor BamB